MYDYRFFQYESHYGKQHFMFSEQFKSCFEKYEVQHDAVGLLFCACFCLKYVNYIDIKWQNPLHAYYDGKR